MSTLRPCQNVISTGSDTLSRADTGQSGSDASGVVVVVAFVTGGVVDGLLTGDGALRRERALVARHGRAHASRGRLVAGGTTTVVAVGVSLPATMIDLPEPQAAASSAQARASDASRRGRPLIP